MKLKNYTSGVPIERTISRIEKLLADAGAKAIGKNYTAGKLESITFQMEMSGQDFLIRLPANPKAVYNALLKDASPPVTKRYPRESTIDKIRIQSDRTAWKIQQDWLEIELTQIRLNQKEMLQVFLSYVWDGNQTYYAALKDKKFTALLPEKL